MWPLQLLPRDGTRAGTIMPNFWRCSLTMALLTGLTLTIAVACTGSSRAPDWERSGDWHRGYREEAQAAEYSEQQGDRLRRNRFSILYPTPDSALRDFYITFSCMDDWSAAYLIALTDVLAGSEAGYEFSVLAADQSALESGPSGTARAGTSGVGKPYRVAIEDKDEIIRVLGVFRNAASREDTAYVKGQVQRERTLESVFDPTGVEDAVQYLECFD